MRALLIRRRQNILWKKCTIFYVSLCVWHCFCFDSRLFLGVAAWTASSFGLYKRPKRSFLCGLKVEIKGDLDNLHFGSNKLKIGPVEAAQSWFTNCGDKNSDFSGRFWRLSPLYYWWSIGILSTRYWKHEIGMGDLHYVIHGWGLQVFTSYGTLERLGVLQPLKVPYEVRTFSPRPKITLCKSPIYLQSTMAFLVSLSYSNILYCCWATKLLLFHTFWSSLATLMHHLCMMGLWVKKFSQGIPGLEAKNYTPSLQIPFPHPLPKNLGYVQVWL